ncbi:MAG: hypothetical protein K8M05_21030, partial [Deltaproteobacteria bacterium]|nr:hypothetical protein [Kofleriaceae bacterium]
PPPSQPAADAPARPGGAGPAQLAGCERIPFATSLPIAEASGAVWLPDGSIVVVSDSGNDAAFVTIDAKDGRILASGKLPLGGGGDDLEGLTAADGLIWAITSSGWMRAWKPRGSGKGYELEVAAYRIDPEDECAADTVNCGNNYEGLCLEPRASAALGGCAGFAAAKTSGELVCLVADENGRYVAAPERRIRVSFPGTLAACDLAEDGTVWTGENLFGRSAVRRVVDGAVVESAFLGEGFPEAMARAPDGTIYRFSDTGGAPSRVAAYRCAPGPTKGASPADGG